MQFIGGLVMGLLLGGEAITALIWMPVAVAMLLLGGWGIYEAVIWFDVAKGAWEPGAWYAWPWHWPGAYFSAQILDKLSAIFGINVAVKATNLGAGLNLISDGYRSAVGAALAAMINVLIAYMPVFVIGQIVRAAHWVRAARRNTD